MANSISTGFNTAYCSHGDLPSSLQSNPGVLHHNDAAMQTNWCMCTTHFPLLQFVKQNLKYTYVYRMHQVIHN